MTKTYSKNLIFLDFDGVCNSHTEGSYKTTTTETYSFSPTIVNRLKKLCDDMEARIVISSNWRRFEDDGYIVSDGTRYYNPLPKLKKELGDYIVDELPKDRHIRKSEALILWMEDNPEFKGNFIILDDVHEEGFGEYPQFWKKFIYCDPTFGFSEEKLKMAEDILKGYES